MNGRLLLFETVFFYHPAVRWLSRRVRIEREHGCDDVAISLLANRGEYGRALLAVAELRGLLPVMALGMGGSSLQTRVRRVCGIQPVQRSWASAVMCLILAIASVATTVLASQPPDADSPDVAPEVIGTDANETTGTPPRLPEWLRPFQGNGLLATLDADGQVVAISAGSVIDDALIGKLKTLPRLKKLYIETSKQIGNEGFRHIGEMPALESLDVYSITVSDQSLEHLSRLTTLRELSLREARISDDGIAHLKEMKQLRALRLGGNRLTDAGIAHLRDLTNLEVLEIPHGNWVDSRMKISDAGLKYVGRFTKLRELDISGLGVTDEGFARLAGLHDLRALSLGGTQITGAGLRQLVNFPELESLALGGTWIRDDAMEHVGTRGKLKRLHLGYTRIGDEGFRHLEKLAHLEHLSINSRYVTDAGLAHLIPLARLTHLDLRASHVTDVSLEHISKVKSLTYLSLNGGGEPGIGSQLPGVQRGRNFTAAGYAHLAALPNLQDMHLTNADVRWTELRSLKQLKSLHMLMPTMSQDDVRQLQKALPDVSISAAWGGGSVAPLQ